MSKPKHVGLLSMCERVKPTDMEKIAELTAAAKGRRTAAAFAEACGVDAATISRILNVRLKKNLSDDVVAAIAVNAADSSGVFFRELLDAHGLAIPSAAGKTEAEQEQLYTDYLDQVRSSVDMARQTKADPPAYRKTRRELLAERVQDTVVNYLVRAGYQVALAPDNELMETLDIPVFADFIIETNALEKEGLSRWGFIVSESVGRNFQNLLENVFGCAYLNRPAKDGMRVTIVTTDEVNFYSMREETLANLTIPDSISILLIHPRISRIEAEFVIKRETESAHVFPGGKTGEEVYDLLHPDPGEFDY